MSTITGLTSTTPTRSPSTDLRDLDVGKFMDLLIAELQNQDPLDPLDNSEMLQQISQIREIGATNQLSDTLQAVLLGQNMGTASGLLGKQVSALTDQGVEVTGEVDRVSVQVRGEGPNAPRQLRVHVGEHLIDLNNIRSIVDSNTGVLGS